MYNYKNCNCYKYFHIKSGNIFLIHFYKDFIHFNSLEERIIGNAIVKKNVFKERNYLETFTGDPSTENSEDKPETSALSLIIRTCKINSLANLADEFKIFIKT